MEKARYNTELYSNLSQPLYLYDDYYQIPIALFISAMTASAAFDAAS